MVLNIGKLRSRAFQYVETELLQMAEAGHQNGAILKVIFENAYLTQEHKIIACRICAGRHKADAQASARGYRDQGSSGVRTLETALQVYDAGCSRFGAMQTVAILDA